MARLTARGRRRLKSSSFAVKTAKGKPNKYPIHDRAHARNALARVAQHGTAAEKRKVRAAVRRKYPSIGRTKKKR